VVAANSAIHSVHDLAHARIAITARLTMSHLLVQSALITNGVDPAGVQWVELPFEQVGPSLSRGQIDAAYLVQPQLTVAAREHGVLSLLDLAAGPTANEPLTGYAALNDWVKAHPDAAQAFHDALEKATLVARTDMAKVNSVLTDELHVTADDAKLANLLAPGFELSLAPERLRRPAQLLHDAGGLPVIPDVAAMIWTPPARH
jgi:NitT/TauT family transport system substrate-binding protein